MELDITEFFNNAEPFEYSASAAELGDNAGHITWQNACNSEFVILHTEDEKDAFREYVKWFGAWSDDEIEAWTDRELNALFIQLVSGDMREGGLYPGMTDEEWSTYEKDAMGGRVSGNIYGGPLSVDGRIYYSLG